MPKPNFYKNAIVLLILRNFKQPQLLLYYNFTSKINEKPIVLYTFCTNLNYYF